MTIALLQQHALSLVAHRPSQVWTPQAIVAETIRAAQRQGVPPLLLLALAIAESNLNPRAERWYRYTAEAKAAIGAGDRRRLLSLMARIELERPGDISFGLCQPTWKWRDPDEFAGAGPGDLDALLAYRERYFDPAYALARGARRIAGFWHRYAPDVLETLCRYNKPALSQWENPAVDNYRRGIREANYELSAVSCRQSGDVGSSGKLMAES